MMDNNPQIKNKIKKNFKFSVLVLLLSLIAWFGVKTLVSKSGATASTSTKKSSSLIQTNVGMGAGGPPADHIEAPSGNASVSSGGSNSR